MLKPLVISSLVLSGFASAMSANAADMGPYVGAGIGQSKIKVDNADFSETATAFKVFAGYSINPYFAVEATYFDGGNPSRDYPLNGRVEVSADGFVASAVGRIPVADSVTIFGKLGYAFYHWDAEGRIGSTVIASTSDSDSDLAYGLGVSFDIGPKFCVRAEYEAVDVSDGDFHTVSLSGAYKF